MVIDLETVAKADQVCGADFRLMGWDDGTLDDGKRFTTASDMHQIGLALRSCGFVGLSVDANDFISSLEGKQLNAAQALQHTWLQQR